RFAMHTSRREVKVHDVAVLALRPGTHQRFLRFFQSFNTLPTHGAPVRRTAATDSISNHNTNGSTERSGTENTKDRRTERSRKAPGHRRLRRPAQAGAHLPHP